MSLMSATILVAIFVISEGSLFSNPYGNVDVLCAENEDCTIIADNNSSTYYFSGNIKCPSDHVCTIICIDSNCNRMTINASYSSNVIVSCISLEQCDYQTSAECYWMNIIAKSINNISIKCQNSKCEGTVIDVDSINTLNFECIDASCSDIYRELEINIKESNNVVLKCSKNISNSGGQSMCKRMVTHITTHNLFVDCLGSASCYMANINAIMFENTTQCVDQDIKSSAGFDINCNGCHYTLFSISSHQNIYHNWSAKQCELETAVIRCGNDIQSCISSTFSVAILGDLQVEFGSAAFNVDIYFNPPLLARNSVNLLCSTNVACLIGTYALTAYQITTNCSCTHNIHAPILPIIKDSESKLIVTDGNIIFTEQIVLNDIHSASVTINCNEANCTDDVYITAIFGYAQITSDIGFKSASCTTHHTTNFSITTCDYHAMKCGFNLQYGPCDSDALDGILERLSVSNIIVSQEYDQLLQCAPNKNCYAYGTKSNTNCPFRSEVCNGSRIECAANTNCTIKSIQSYAFSEITATTAEMLTLSGFQYGSFSKTIVTAPRNGASIFYNLGENGFSGANIDAQNSTLFVLGEYGLVHSTIHLENAEDARIVCENSAGCRNSKIYITYTDIDIENNDIIPFDRFCFECYRDAYYPPISNITFIINDGSGMVVYCSTQYNNTEYKYYCHDADRNRLYPLDLCHTTQDDWGVDGCEVQKFGLLSNYQQNIVSGVPTTQLITTTSPAQNPTILIDDSSANTLDVLIASAFMIVFGWVI